MSSATSIRPGLSRFTLLTLGWPQDTTGLDEGWITDDQFIDLCRITGPAGRAYVNPCIGCDRIHDRHLGAVLAGIRAKRRRGGRA